MDPRPDPHAVARALRVQRYGRRGPRGIADPLVEPLWSGARVIASVGEGAVHMFHDGREIVVGDEMGAAVSQALGSAAAVLEGHLTPEALATGEGAELEREQRRRRPLGMIADALLPGGGRRERFIAEREASARDQRAAAEAVRSMEGGNTLPFVVTDLLWLDDVPVLDVPLLERRRLLAAVLDEADLVRRTTYVRPSAAPTLSAWRALGFRTLAIKGANSRYLPGETNDEWGLAPAPATIAASPFR